ncbi:hypothetical protein ACI1MP_37945 (plasmid) [Kitasatospora griseola]|uniref:hypothetical protein n=1 Tax=Kitasatospora griseola TaxID=2064 RepID=UPI003855B7FA
MTTATAADRAATEHGSTIIRTLEAAWSAMRGHHPDLPAVVMITGHGRRPGKDSVTWGHHWAGRWTAADGTAVRAELFAGGELLALGGRRIMQTLLHEGVHALATVKGIKDTSSNGRYHNKTFAKMATEFGLQPPSEPDDRRRGYSNCLLTDEAAERYAAVIARLDTDLGHRIEDPLARLIAAQASGPGEELAAAIELQPGAEGTELPEPPEPKRRTETPRGGKRLAIVCRCLTHPVRDAHGGQRDEEGPRRIQATPGLLDGGPIICGTCGAEFEPEG